MHMHHTVSRSDLGGKILFEAPLLGGVMTVSKDGQDPEPVLLGDQQVVIDRGDRTALKTLSFKWLTEQISDVNQVYRHLPPEVAIPARWLAQRLDYKAVTPFRAACEGAARCASSSTLHLRLAMDVIQHLPKPGGRQDMRRFDVRQNLKHRAAGTPRDVAVPIATDLINTAEAERWGVEAMSWSATPSMKLSARITTALAFGAAIAAARENIDPVMIGRGVQTLIIIAGEAHVLKHRVAVNGGLKDLAVDCRVAAATEYSRIAAALVELLQEDAA